MLPIAHDLASFNAYVRATIEAGQRDLTIDEIFARWRIENPTVTQYAENVAAIQASISDYRSGERGTIAGEHSQQLRRQFGLREE